PNYNFQTYLNNRKKSLRQAAMAGDIATINAFLGRGVSINTKDFDGNTPLHLAAHYGRNQLVKLLLEKGADKNLTISSTNKSGAVWIAR
ncbi:MAG: ankyrin repeat domain-containing protein, partial [Proteobacteria bacterium]|nr:ankyrin repeat domain-containing protein [Pseudomonadota bacterium]